MHKKQSKKLLTRVELRFWQSIDLVPAAYRKVRENIGHIALVVFLCGGVAAIGVLTTSLLTPQDTPGASGPLPSAHASETPVYHGKHEGHAHSKPPVHHKLAKHRRDYVVVRPGDTLWKIAQRYLKDPYKWSYLWQLNQGHIQNPNMLHVGERVWL